MGCEHQLNMTNLENVWKPPAGENDQKDKKWGKQGRFLCRRVQSLSPPSDWPFCFWLTIVLCNKLYPAYMCDLFAFFIRKKSLFERNLYFNYREIFLSTQINIVRVCDLIAHCTNNLQPDVFFILWIIRWQGKQKLGISKWRHFVFPVSK